MVLDYSKWENLEVSSDEDPTPNVIKLNSDQQVVLEKGGYKIKDRSGKLDNKSEEPKDLSKEWYKRVLHGVVTPNSHIFGQDRYEINFLLLVNFEYKKLRVELEESFLNVFDGDKKLFSKEFYSKIRQDDNFWNWEIVTLTLDWDSLKEFSQKLNKDKQKTTLFFKNPQTQKFLEVNFHKLMEIQDCFIWWPKLFKDDVEQVKVVDNSEFLKVWEEAHEEFRKKVSAYEKFQVDEGE